VQYRSQSPALRRHPSRHGPKSSIVKGRAFHIALPALAIKLKLDGSRGGGRPPRRVGLNLLLRPKDHKHYVPRFLTNPAVPFTNDQAERAARMLEPRSGSRLKQNMSCWFRSVQGADDFAVIQTFSWLRVFEGPRLWL
jgi:transposase